MYFSQGKKEKTSDKVMEILSTPVSDIKLPCEHHRKSMSKRSLAIFPDSHQPQCHKYTINAEGVANNWHFIISLTFIIYALFINFALIFITLLCMDYISSMYFKELHPWMHWVTPNFRFLQQILVTVFLQCNFLDSGVYEVKVNTTFWYWSGVLFGLIECLRPSKYITFGMSRQFSTARPVWGFRMNDGTMIAEEIIWNRKEIISL